MVEGKVTSEQLFGRHTAALLDELEKTQAIEDLAEPVYLEGVLKSCLGCFADEGFKLIECNDHTVRLEHDGEALACFNATTVTITVLRQACHRHLCNYH